MLPHHRSTSPEEFKEASRPRPRPPVLPHHRLFKARGWNLPVPEILFLIAGFVIQRIDSDPTSTMTRLAIVAEAAGLSGLLVGIPLLFVPLRVFWFDLAYIVAGLAIYSYMMTFVDGSYIFLALVPIAGLGMVLSGTSFLMRRAAAHRLARRRVQK